nr:DUF3237 domain-containing protein [Oscillochloris sp. ZM17-4]
MMTLHAEVKPPVEVGKGPQGQRLIGDCTGGSFEGPRLRGTVLPSGGDWLLIDPAGVGHVDGRLTLQTADGAPIYMQYYGIARSNAQVGAALAQGRAAEYGDMYYFIQPRFETGDARYAWLNGLVAVAEGRLMPGGAEYTLFNLAS